MAQNSSDPNMVLDHGRYKGTALKDVPDSYVKWMINYSEGEMQFWQAEQMRRKLMVGTQDGTPLIVELTRAVAKVLEDSGKLAADTNVRQFVEWARQAAAQAAQRPPPHRRSPRNPHHQPQPPRPRTC